ncbi:hypothetical protein BOSEA1005_12310 [Hyphomicrobiales bacterium]|nr:hypothetical protein BOSEA1005_12310 [Hyphomicrobiales bacterium]CAI0343044.1 hypothetical protein BO1005MUT1_210109 [Hyphomicrobiales bacterium]
MRSSPLRSAQYEGALQNAMKIVRNHRRHALVAWRALGLVGFL